MFFGSRSLKIEYSWARRGAEKLWEFFKPSDTSQRSVHSAATKPCSKSGWIKGDLLERLASGGGRKSRRANVSGPKSLSRQQRSTRGPPHQSSVAARAIRSQHAEGRKIDWFAPIVADAEAGFGGALNVFELIKAMIEAGAAGVHLEDQLASEKKCGHMGGKVLVPTADRIRNLIAARLAADVSDVPTILIARTDAGGAALITSDVDERDHEFLTGERTSEGFFRVRAGSIRRSRGP